MSTNNQDTNRSSILSSRSFLRRCLLVAMVGSSASAPRCAYASSSDEIATMSAGDGTTCAVTDDGNAKCWGNNDAGQLGRGDTNGVGDDEVPGAVSFIDLGGLAKDVQSNGWQTFALLDDGTVRAWGANDEYQLGLGHAIGIGDDETPAEANATVDVELGGSAIQIAVGSDFACALLEGGAVQCWGTNLEGQLGYGHTRTIGDDESPADAGDVSLGRDAVSLAAGAHHVCALLDDGTVRCWGLGDAGQLGLGSTDSIGDDELPSAVSRVPLTGIAVEITAGEGHTCARLDTGAVQCWGANDAGQLGYGHTRAIGDDETLTSSNVVGLPGPATAIAAGARHSCALMVDGGLYCWGDGLDGRLGYGDEQDVGDDELPRDAGPVRMGGHSVSKVFIGPTASTTCVELGDGGVRCWGLGDVGQLGYGNTKAAGDTPQTTPGHLPDIIVVDDSPD